MWVVGVWGLGAHRAGGRVGTGRRPVIPNSRFQILDPGLRTADYQYTGFQDLNPGFRNSTFQMGAAGPPEWGMQLF